MRPSEHVLDLFAVPGDVEPLPGGQGHSVRAGDLVLSPGRDPEVLDLLGPALARLAADLDTRPGRDQRDLRVAMPVPARDGEWVVDGWAATRFEPGTRLLTELSATRAVGAVLHAELARVVGRRPLAREAARDRWAAAERVAFGEAPVPDGAPQLVRALLDRLEGDPLGPEQLVHGDLAGNILLDPRGAPVVLDVSPYWRPAAWAEAVWVLDSVLWWGADPEEIRALAEGPGADALARAAIFRILSDRPPRVDLYEQVLTPLLTRRGASGPPS